jgi:REP element-mobilizing transposase RayT
MHHSHLLRKGRASIPLHYYVITAVTFERKNIFKNHLAAKIAIQSLYNLEQKEAIKIICYVLMPDHLHCQFQLLEHSSLSQIVKQFKGSTAYSLNKTLNIKNVWQKGYYDHNIRNEKDLIKQARYIVANPLRAGLVNNIGNYPYWNCIYL